MKFLSCTLVVVGLISTLGCQIPEFEHPLVQPDQAELPMELIGSYVCVNESSTGTSDDVKSSSIEIDKAGNNFPDGFVTLVVTTEKEKQKKVEKFIGFTKKMGDHYFLHLPIPEKPHSPDQQNWNTDHWDPKEYSRYLIASLVCTDDGLQFGLLDGEFFKQEVEAGRLAGISEFTEMEAAIEAGEDVVDDPDSEALPPDSLRITADTETLLRFFADRMGKNLLLEENTQLWQRVDD